ncbi:hypothetical protein DPMN_060577 [Dreissena polymorpha]|uniref:Uncharacterized protein n=1 Tax=Dreissena polymorpha TaxID=45954 RepID=A0A9D4C640_DREPO|nr:hypothetical protein DPMN_060577 [Dreissena polymorpha]
MSRRLVQGSGNKDLHRRSLPRKLCAGSQDPCVAREAPAPGGQCPSKSHDQSAPSRDQQLRGHWSISGAVGGG